MMRFLVLFFLSILVAYLLGPVLPHWALMLVIAFLAALVGGGGASAFFAAALAVAVVWFFVPFFIIRETGSAPSDNMALIFGLRSPLFLMGATSLPGCFLGGFSALTGNLFRKIFEKDKLTY